MFEPAGEPHATGEADLDGEREPRLDAGVQEAEARMQEVLVQVQALARPKPEPAFVAVLGAVVLEGHTGFEGRQHADKPLLNRVFDEEFAGNVLLVDRGRLQVEDRPVEPAGLGKRRFLETLGGVDGELLEVEQLNLGGFEEEVHAAVAHERQQMAAEDETIEAGQHPGDERAKTCYEILHGVLLGREEVLSTPSYPRKDAASLKLGCG